MQFTFVAACRCGTGLLRLRRMNWLRMTAVKPSRRARGPEPVEGRDASPYLSINGCGINENTFEKCVARKK